MKLSRIIRNFILIALNNKQQESGHILQNRINNKRHTSPRRTVNLDEAIHLLRACESGAEHSDFIKQELGAIISHWLQSPLEEPLFLDGNYAEKWSKILNSYLLGGSKALFTGISKEDFTRPKLNFETLPYPPVKKAKFKFIDLFAGIGGFRLALQSFGGKCVMSSEWDPDAKETYHKNYGEIPFGNIKNITESRDPRKRSILSHIPAHDILAGGFPCQAFSQAGLELGFQDARGTLFFDILKIAKEKKPAALILENVKRLRTHDKGRTFAIITNSLKELGYTVYSKILKAYDFGVPQNRERIFIVAFREKLQFQFPDPSGKRIYKNMGEVLEMDVPKTFTITDKILAGHKRRRKEHKAKGNGFGFSVFKKDANYVNTISARYWKDGSEILIDQGNENPRMLTPRECARIQGFPDCFIVSGSKRAAYQQFGNSVAVPVVTAVARQVLKALDIPVKLT